MYKLVEKYRVKSFNTIAEGKYINSFPNVVIELLEKIDELDKSIHWAGTETATVWNGYLEGAVRSDEREAIKIAILLLNK